MRSIPTSIDPQTSIIRFRATRLRVEIDRIGANFVTLESALNRSGGYLCRIADRTKSIGHADAHKLSILLDTDISDIFELTPDSADLLNQWEDGKIVAIDGEHARFWSKVRMTGLTAESCWEWTRSTNAQGYGQIALWVQAKRPVLAHRLAFEITFGAIPDGMHVLHDCDNPLCVRPTHLHIGTHADNMREMGERHRRKKWKLVAEDVIAIRALNPQTKAEINVACMMFGVSETTIQNVIKRISWKHV